MAEKVRVVLDIDPETKVVINPVGKALAQPMTATETKAGLKLSGSGTETARPPDRIDADVDVDF
jgi:hypothetical protein